MLTGADIEQALRSRGHALSQPRVRLISKIAGLRDHFSAEELVAGLPGLSRATVFRTLRLLVNLEIVCQVRLIDGTPRYRLVEDAHRHHHLLCAECGRVSDMVAPEIDASLRQVESRTGLQVWSHRLEAYGLCGECAVRAREPARTPSSRG
jgi:Fe2+ or Zn2+ uptake regulation protein